MDKATRETAQRDVYCGRQFTADTPHPLTADTQPEALARFLSVPPAGHCSMFILSILILMCIQGFHYRPLTIYSLVICPAIGGAHGGRADCKGVRRKHSHSWREEAMTKPLWAPTSLVAHKISMSVQFPPPRLFLKIFPTRPTQAIPWNKTCSQDLVIAGLL